MLEQEWMDKIYNIQLLNEKEIEKKSQQIQQIEKYLFYYQHYMYPTKTIKLSAFFYRQKMI